MTVRNSFSLLALEGHLFHASLTHGLTALRAANTNNHKGVFFAAFFHLSIGLERLMKVILVIDHMARNSNTPPSNRALRRHGHDLITLFNYLESLPDPAPNPLARVSRTEIAFQVLSFLSNFAKNTRYYNLDSLVAPSSSTDPLSEWHGIITAINLADVTARQRRKAQEQAREVVAAALGTATIIDENLDGSPMTLYDAALLPQVYDLAARHAVFHVLEIVQPLKELLGCCVDRSHQVARSLGVRDCPVPYMVEFLDFFFLDKQQILRKRRWP